MGNLKELTKIEHKFLKEIGTVPNKNGVFKYTNSDGSESFLLDYVLLEYRQWLIENNIVLKI